MSLGAGVQPRGATLLKVMGYIFYVKNVMRRGADGKTT